MAKRRSLEELQREMKARHPEGARGPGRPPLPIDPVTVENLASQGCKISEIAALVGCDEKTIRTRFAQQFNRGIDRFTGSAKLAAYQLGLEGGDVRALIRQIQLRSWPQRRRLARAAPPLEKQKYLRHRPWPKKPPRVKKPPTPKPEAEPQQDRRCFIVEFAL